MKAENVKDLMAKFSKKPQIFGLIWPCELDTNKGEVAIFLIHRYRENDAEINFEDFSIMKS